MQNKIIEQVAEFHRAFDHPIMSGPGIPNTQRRMLRIELIEEEAREFRRAVHDFDLPEIADAIGDLMYVTVGAALEFGLGDILDDIMTEIHRSNMSKLGEDGKPIQRADGKSLKGPNFSLPDLQKIISEKVHSLRANVADAPQGDGTGPGETAIP